jgi:hypothetical protein
MTKQTLILAIVGGIIAAFTLVFLGFALGGYAEIQQQELQNQRYAPFCPTEDSCRADYRDGHWWIIEQTP